jgi:hypothetical protein
LFSRSCPGSGGFAVARLIRALGGKQFSTRGEKSLVRLAGFSYQRQF